MTYTEHTSITEYIISCIYYDTRISEEELTLVINRFGYASGISIIFIVPR